VTAPDAATASPSASAASYPLRIQAIRTTKGQNVRFFVYIPMPLAAALGGEEVSWKLLDRKELHLVRAAPTPVKA